MFRITTRQLRTFERMAASDFEEQLVEHCAAFWPRLAAAPGRERLLTIVRAAIARAAGYGFTLSGPVRLFIELGFLFGSGFDTDVQHPWARAYLTRQGETRPVGPDIEQMDCAAGLHHAAMDALSAIRGPHDRYIHAALRRLLALAAEPSPSRVDDLPAFALSALERVHPEKYAFVGEPALRELFAAGADEAARHGLEAPRDVLLLVAMMFAYGQGCTSDPIHAWIGRALTDETIATPALRARRLEERALSMARDALADMEIGQ
ncbi:uncharacterized protein SOCE26_057950 [Sorangium cellulosum]|uniref:Uncharacterized protein n=1 Tax=Sorangium cellulosum TaxID=56 RepID=A0A2L0EYD8_SORCE|nr:hypothetical protein [Sorangium cellulosum]AUX44331.1 uncharacterized protein SOCE26_057950 [Sorangium cellulosum]